MHKQAEKPKENKSRAAANSVTQTKSSGKQGFGFVDNRPEAIVQRELQITANNHPQTSQLKATENTQENSTKINRVIQRIQFRQGQDHQVMGWVSQNNLHTKAPFANLWQRYQQNNGLDNNDAEAITMLFLTMIPIYRDFAHRDVAINYLYNQYFGFYPKIGLINAVTPPASVAEFSNKYKTFFHLYSRALLAGQVGNQAIYTVHTGMTGLSQNLGNKTQAPVTIPGQAANTDDERIEKIYAACRTGSLRFPSQSSAVSHLIKHGSMYNFYKKITGQEGAQNLGLMLDNYVEDANYAIRIGTEQAGSRDITLGRHVYTFTTDAERAMVSCAADGSDAFIATYFWNEPPAYVNDQVAANGTNPNIQ